jgi:tetratricopeptide (TPR) repeat protein
LRIRCGEIDRATAEVDLCLFGRRNMPASKNRLLCVAAWVVLCATGGAARAELEVAVEIAQRHFERGRDAYTAGDYVRALGEFRAARQAKPLPALDYNMGRCYERLGRIDEAVAAYQRYVTSTPRPADAAEVQRLVGALAAAARPLPALPLPVTPPRVRTPRRAAGVALTVVGASLAVAGAVTGGLVLAERDRYQAGCAAGACDQALYDQAHRLAVSTDALLGVGLPAALVGAILTALRPAAPRAWASGRVTLGEF